MRTRHIRFVGGTNRWAYGLYLRAFPKDERTPRALIHVLSLRRGVDLVAWWDQSAGPIRAARPDPVALTWTVRRPDSRLLYLFYLAVDDAACGCGVGTRLLAELERRHLGCAIVLDIELVIAEADNAEQRRRRFFFYEHSGFHDTGYAVRDSTGEYWTLAREAPGTTFDPDDFRDTPSCPDCGFITARVVPQQQIQVRHRFIPQSPPMTRAYHYNGFRTAILLGGIWSLLLLLGYMLARGTGSAIWLVIAPVIGLVQTALGSWNSDKIAVRSMGVIEVTEARQPQMYAIARELSTVTGQPMPRLYMAPMMGPNAFATSHSPSHAAMCYTQGTLQLLNERELRGILGHELSHVHNRDILTSSVVAGIAGVISSMVTMAMWFGGGNWHDRNGGNIIAVLLLSLLAPLAAAITQFAISRTHEYDADHDGAELAQDPLALASAFSKLESGVSRVLMGQDLRLEPVSSMMIANPFGNLRNLFTTRPPMDKRIAHLEQMAGY